MSTSLLSNKVIIVTGAGSGIGLATAKILAAAGAKVVLGGRDLSEVQSGVGENHRAGEIALGLAVDVASEADVAVLIDRTLAAFGRLDGAFNNAGVEMHGKLTADLSVDQWDGVLAVDVRGLFLCMKHKIKAMQKTGGGAIVNNGSMNSFIAIPHATEYVAAKHAVSGATRGASSEARETGVRFNAVLPDLIPTSMIERLKEDPGFKEHYTSALERHSVGRFGQPEDVAYAVKWLLSDEAAFVNGAHDCRRRRLHRAVRRVQRNSQRTA